MDEFFKGQIAWYEDNIRLAKQSIELMEAGGYGTYTVTPEGRTDTTAQTLADEKRYLALWEDQLAALKKRAALT